MSKREHRIYFSSAYCERNFNLGNFTVNLPISLDLTGIWRCAIRDIFISSASISSIDYIYILGDFCETSILHREKLLPVLSKVFLENKEKYYNFPDPLYIPLKQNQLSSFELRFLNPDLKTIDFGEKFLIECTLHLYKYGG